MLVHWVCNFFIGQTFLSAVTSVGLPAVYVFFAVVALAGAW